MGRRVELLKACLTTSFGLGFAPVAPGTAGSLPGVALYLLVVLATPRAWHAWLIGAGLATACVEALALGSWAERHWGRKDPRPFVLDEVAGFLLTVLLFRVESVVATLIWAFCMTRLFDILKPPPVRQLEKLPAGWGMLLDDLFASVYAVLALYAAAALWPRLFGLGA